MSYSSGGGLAPHTTDSTLTHELLHAIGGMEGHPSGFQDLLNQLYSELGIPPFTGLGFLDAPPPSETPTNGGDGPPPDTQGGGGGDVQTGGAT